MTLKYMWLYADVGANELAHFYHGKVAHLSFVYVVQFLWRTSDDSLLMTLKNQHCCDEYHIVASLTFLTFFWCLASNRLITFYIIV